MILRIVLRLKGNRGGAKSTDLVSKLSPGEDEIPLAFQHNKKSHPSHVVWRDGISISWWRRGESNPCPKEQPQEHLRA